MLYATILVPLLGVGPAIADPLPNETEDVAVTVPQEEEEPAGPELPHWSGDFLFGLTDTRGNSKTLSVAADANAVREAEMNRWTLRAFYNYAEADDTINDRRAGGTAKYDYLAGERYYYFANAGLETDDQADIDLRYAAGGGLGYKFLDKKKIREKGELDVEGELGLVYFKEKYSSDSSSDNVAAQLGYHGLYKHSEDIEFKQDFVAFPAVDDVDDIYLLLDNKLTMSLTDSMVSAFIYELDWDNTPASGAKKTDHRFVITIGWTFGK